MTDELDGERHDPLAPWLGTALRAIRDEIDEARGAVASEVDIVDGALIDERQGRALMRFRVEEPVRLAPESPVQVRIPGVRRPLAGTLVAADDFGVLLDVEDHGELTPSVPRAGLAADAAFVLAAQRKRIEAALDEPDTWGPLPRLVCGIGGDAIAAAASQLPAAGIEPRSGSGAGGGGGEPDNSVAPPDHALDGLNTAQRAAVARALDTSLLFVWGPPGTGKTTTLGAAAAASLARGERVLILAHANVAVDGALLASAARIDPGTIGAGLVVRAGTPQTDELRERPDLLLADIAAARSPGLSAELAELAGLRASVLASLLVAPTPDAGERLDAIRARAREVRSLLAAREQEVMDEASLIATTSARAAIDARVFGSRFDTVIVDESSVMGLTPSLLAAALASRRVLFFGDFRQLPPVVLASSDAARKLLVRDAFAASGAQAAVERGGDDPRVALLDLQYRMTEPICGVVNRASYGGRLRTQRTDLGDRSGPWGGESVVLVDTSELGGRVVRDPGDGGRAGSPFNPVQAMVTAAVAGALGGEGRSVAVMSPYRAHTRLLGALIAGDGAGRPTAATVHRFQGAEADRVVVDLADGPPMQRATPLTGGDDDLARRLMNVAMSRARDRLVVVADRDFLERVLPASSAVRRAIAAVAEEGRVIRLMPAAIADALRPRLLWRPHAGDALTALVHGASGPVRLNIVEADTGDIARLAQAVAATSYRITVHAPLLIAEAFEDGPADLHLDVRPVGCLGMSSDRLILAIDGLDGEAFEMTGRSLVRAVRAILRM